MKKMKTITVKDLIDKLKTFDEELVVFVDGYEYGIQYLELDSVKEEKIVLNVNNDGHYYCGEHEIDDDSDYIFDGKEKIKGILISR